MCLFSFQADTAGADQDDDLLTEEHLEAIIDRSRKAGEAAMHNDGGSSGQGSGKGDTSDTSSKDSLKFSAGRRSRLQEGTQVTRIHSNVTV